MPRFLFLICLIVPPASAQVRPLSLNDLCARAGRVVIGGISKVESRWVGQRIVTDVTVVPSENLKGAGSAPFVLTVPGGTIGNVTLRASEAPLFSEGEMVVLFVAQGQTPCGVYGWFRGKYTIVNGQVRELVDTSLASFRDQLQEIIENL